MDKSNLLDKSKVNKSRVENASSHSKLKKTIIAYDSEFKFKIVLVGDSNVGKTSIFGRYIDEFYDEEDLEEKQTTMVDFRMKNQVIDNDLIKLYIWDTAGQERYRSVISSYFKGTHGIIGIFDLQDLNSFNSIKEHWVKQYKEKAPDSVFALVGNKSDLNNKKVSQQMIDEFCDINECKYCEVSAKLGTNIEELFLSNIFEKMFKIASQSQKNVWMINQFINLRFFATEIPKFQVKGSYLLPVPPKRPASVFNLYMQEKQKGITEKKSITEVAKLMSAEYKDEEKDKDIKQMLNQQYLENLKKYQEAKKEYDSKYSIPSIKISAYTLFLKEKMKQFNPATKDLKVTQKMGIYGKQWKNLEKSKTEKYEKMAQDIKQISSKTVEEFAKSYKIPQIKQKTGYNIFVGQFQPKDQENKFKEASQAWKTLPESEKESFKNKSVEDFQQQQKDFQQFCLKMKITPEQLEKIIQKNEKKNKKSEQAQK